MVEEIEVPKLETTRLILRSLSMDDAPAIQKHFNNWNIIKEIGSVVPWPYPDDGAVTHLKNTLNQPLTYLWGITLKDNPDEVIGVIEYRLSDNADDNRGFWLAESHWGQGLMGEAVTATQDFVFFELGIKRIVVTNAKSNARSRAVKEKHGAKLIGMSKGKYHTGEVDQEVWEITKDSWVNTLKN